MEKTNKSKAKYCRNCHYPLSQSAIYCSNCSQKYTTGKITVGQLFKDLISNLFNLDSKLFKTLGGLFIPARLTNNYFKGKHKRYASPLRVFIVCAIICIAALSLLLNQEDLSLSQFGEELENFEEQLHLEKIDSISEVLIQIYPQKQVSLALDSLEKLMIEDLDIDTARNFNFNTFKASSIFFSDTVETYEIYTSDLLLSHEEICEKYKIEYLIDKIVLKQSVKFAKTGDLSSFLKYLISNIIWLLLLQIPTMALILKLLYIRSEHYYVEHLVFLLHFHAFLLFIGAISYSSMLILMYAFDYLLPMQISSIIFLIAPFYLYKAFRNFYQQRRFKTLIKFLAFNFTYFFFFLFFLLFIGMFSFLFY